MKSNRKQVRVTIKEEDVKKFNKQKEKLEAEFGIKMSDSQFASTLISKSLS